MSQNGASEFIEAGPLARYPPGSGTLVERPDTCVALAVFNVEGRLFGLEDECLCCGGSLAAGTLLARTVKCPGCDWIYDIATGCVLSLPSLRTDAFEVRIIDSQVIVASLPRVRRGAE